jgi:DNA-binding HxlR family transcriptional regulator
LHYASRYPGLSLNRSKAGLTRFLADMAARTQTQMASKNQHTLRSSCPVACGLDAVGDHWTMLIVRDMLVMNKHEYKEFLESEEGISSNILSDRLDRLQKNGLVAAIPHPDSKRRKLYYLTPPGKDLIHVLVAIAGWAFKHQGEDITFHAPVDPDSKTGVKDFIRQTFATLKSWEKQHQIDQA